MYKSHIVDLCKFLRGILLEQVLLVINCFLALRTWWPAVDTFNYLVAVYVISRIFYPVLCGDILIQVSIVGRKVRF
jgi:hypothetical protein